VIQRPHFVDLDPSTATVRRRSDLRQYKARKTVAPSTFGHRERALHSTLTRVERKLADDCGFIGLGRKQLVRGSGRWEPRSSGSLRRGGTLLSTLSLPPWSGLRGVGAQPGHLYFRRPPAERAMGADKATLLYSSDADHVGDVAVVDAPISEGDTDATTAR
jgi:hypothetical protein